MFLNEKENVAKPGIFSITAVRTSALKYLWFTCCLWVVA